jgi:hypothetical protein
MRTWAVMALLTLACVAIGAQPNARRLTTIETIERFPGFYHLQTVVLRGEFVERESSAAANAPPARQIALRSDGSYLSLINPSQATKGAVEVRGQLIDVGRLDQSDPRLGNYAERRGGVPWPRPGTELALNIAGVLEAQPPTAPSVRHLSLEPWKFEGQKVTIVGNFRGKNLFGDLPAAPGNGRYDFVLGGVEGALWVVGLRPRGSGFDLDVERRVDSNRWLQVTGVIGRSRGLVTLTATQIALAKQPEPEPPETAADTSAPPPPAPAEVVFSIPTAGEVDVARNVTVRAQFSRGLRPASLENCVRVTYAGDGADTSPIEFKTSYDVGLRAVQITFARPLEPFRTVKVELLEGVSTFDGGAVVPWSLSFTVGR